MLFTVVSFSVWLKLESHARIEFVHFSVFCKISLSRNGTVQDFLSAVRL